MMMKTRVLLGVGAGLAGLAALPGYSQSSSDAQLEASCRATEATMPDSCPCTITQARAVGLSNPELASLFKDDGHSQPIDQAKYSLFWQVKSKCIADTMMANMGMANMGISANNPLPGVPQSMRPQMPAQAPGPVPNVPIPQTRSAPPVASTQVPASQRELAPIPASAKGDYSTPGKRTVADIEGMIAQLANTAWEFTEDDGRYHRIDFLPEGNIMAYQTRDPGANGSDFTDVSQLSAEATRYGAIMRSRNVTTGSFGDFPINSLSENVLNYQKRYVRTGEEWLFEKIGPASTTLHDNAPEQLEDGFWRVNFNTVSKNPIIIGQNQLQSYANPANRTLRSTAIAGTFNAGFLIGNEGSEDCNSSCFFVVNDYDRRQRRVRSRLIDEAGMDFVGVRPEPSSGTANVISLRVYDGLGGWKQWRCSSQNQALSCTSTGAQEAAQQRPAIAQESSGSLLAQLGAVQGATWGEAGCSGDLYFLPADGRMPQGVDALWAHIRVQKSSHFATQVDTPEMDKIGYKLKLNGEDVVLPPIRQAGGTSEYSNGSMTLLLTNVGQSIGNPNEPSYGFQQVRAEISTGSDSESFDAISLGAC
ncbi:MAG: hypothetical protein AAFR64_09530 [Pseudomonadota bacterium]